MAVGGGHIRERKKGPEMGSTFLKSTPKGRLFQKRDQRQKNRINPSVKKNPKKQNKSKKRDSPQKNQT